MSQRIVLTLIVLLVVAGAAVAVFTSTRNKPTADGVPKTKWESTDDGLPRNAEAEHEPDVDWKAVTDDEWRQRLTAEQYQVTRRKGTERAFTGRYWDNKDDGVYRCVCCEKALFDSRTKYESGTGWPSFWKPLSREAVAEENDYKLFMRRTEVLCRRCGSHLGHVFDDGPQPTGLRYCLNSAALKFEERAETTKDAKPPANSDEESDPGVNTAESELGDRGAPK